MTDPAARALKDLLGAADDDGATPRLQQMVVESTRDDGKVNLRWGESVFDGIPCSSSYVNRRAGDVVTVQMTSAGWLVQPPAGPAPPTAQVDTTVTRWGTGAPEGSGWQKATQVWVRDGEVYAQLDAAPTVPPSAPTNSPKVSIGPNNDVLYSNGRRFTYYNGGHPVQGGYGNYAGAWFYGTKIADACTGKTVKAMSLRLVRRAAGQSVSIRPRLYLHDSATTTNTTPALHNLWTPAKGLSRGESDTYDLPSALVNQLASGTAKGFAVRASGGYVLQYGAASGALTITFD